MRVKTLLSFTAVVSSLLGALVAYLVLSVPNDLRADSLLKQARQDITDGRNDSAKESLRKIVQQYPRTDAAAAATVALSSLADKEREELARSVALLRTQNERQMKQIDDLRKSVAAVRAAPAASTATVTAPPAATKKKPTVKKKTTPKKKPTPKKRPTKRRRR